MLDSFMKSDISPICEDYKNWSETFTSESCCPCKALTNECSIMRDLVFQGYTEGYGEPYAEETEMYQVWCEVFQ